MGWVAKFGQYLDRKFPSKMSTDDVLLHFKVIKDELESKIAAQSAELNQLRAQFGDLTSDHKTLRANLTNLVTKNRSEQTLLKGPSPTEGWSR